MKSYFLIFIYFIRFILSTLYGSFILSITLYLFADYFFEIRVYSFTELLNWYIEQSEQTKNTILGSLITILGFLIAYASAMSNSKAQLTEGLKQQVLLEINQMFIESSKAAVECEIYANALVKCTSELQSGISIEKQNFLMNYYYDQAANFISNKDKLRRFSVDVHDLMRRHALLILSVPFAKSYLDNSINALNQIVNNIYFNIPLRYSQTDLKLSFFLEQTENDKYQKFSQIVRLNDDIMNKNIGALNGAFGSKLIGLNFWSIYNFYKINKDSNN
ncbi:hypothetical protein [Pseudoalteromonas simplex]|uniref:hypothetical protein n=1 Tax=Pseudoalteromonas simplex TaxID=2783613 RepID=UPI0018888CD7|nr:hypothetical protein [Pseudoalteromonas sp. A520]